MVARFLFTVLAFAMATAAVAPPTSNLTALASIAPGQWGLHVHGRAGLRSICLGDPEQLLQLRHGGAICSRFVIANEPTQTIVHYTCPGAGHGRTVVRVETAQLIQIESQGIADNAPFDFEIEGRRVGECSATAGR